MPAFGPRDHSLLHPSGRRRGLEVRFVQGHVPNVAPGKGRVQLINEIVECILNADINVVISFPDLEMNVGSFHINNVLSQDPLDKLYRDCDESLRNLSTNILRRLWGFCQVIYSQFGLAIHQNDHQARRRFVEWAQNEIAVVPDFHKRILFSDEAHFWLNGYVNKQNCRIWSEANPQVYIETSLHPEKLTVWCALRAGGILLQKR
ncbi:hypothetical protein TNCV_1652261 [Trichonephila clavipes]|nr:hypothetical protein TNCV_1652261 [Trichonephila clavipes]